MTAVGARQRRKLERQLAALRREWKGWHTGQNAVAQWGWWGIPLCNHRAPVSTCEGCATRAYCRTEAAAIEQQAAELQRQLDGRPADQPAEGELLALVGGQWVMA